MEAILIPMYLEKYSFNRDESHMAFREEKLVYFSDNHVSIELGNQTLMTSYLYVGNGRAIKKKR